MSFDYYKNKDPRLVQMLAKAFKSQHYSSCDAAYLISPDPPKPTKTNPFSDFGKVELWRYCFGDLPNDDHNPADFKVSKGADNLADAIMSYDPPHPQNVYSALKYIAEVLKDNNL